MTLLIYMKSGKKYQVTEVDDYGMMGSLMTIIKKSVVDNTTKPIAGFNIDEIAHYTVDGEAHVFELTSSMKE